MTVQWHQIEEEGTTYRLWFDERLQCSRFAVMKVTPKGCEVVAEGLLDAALPVGEPLYDEENGPRPPESVELFMLVKWLTMQRELRRNAR